MQYFIPRVVHQDSAVPSEPTYDPLVGICNPYATAQDILLHFYTMDGKEHPKSPLRYTLKPGRSVATTLITNNVFPDPPQNFEGFGIIELPDMPGPLGFGSSPGLPLPAMCCLGGDGPTPANWNYSSPSVQLLDTPQKSSGTGSRWAVPYMIHYEDPQQHAGVHAYRTGIAITNRDTVDAQVTIVLTVGDFYPNAGQQLTATLTVPAGQSIALQAHEVFPALLTMNQRPDGSYEGCEGWLDFKTASPANLAIWTVAANETYDDFGVGQVAWLIE